MWVCACELRGSWSAKASDLPTARVIEVYGLPDVDAGAATASSAFTSWFTYLAPENEKDS